MSSFCFVDWQIIQGLIDWCPVISPTVQEFEDFNKFTQYLDTHYKPYYGMVKVRPPAQWRPSSQDYTQFLKILKIKGPIEQSIQGKEGIYEYCHIQKPQISYPDYVKMNKTKEAITEGKQPPQIQALFWSSLIYSPALYGADLTGTLMNERAGNWNLNNLKTLLSKAVNKSLKGVTSSYCYIGSWKSCFCWHKEDLDLSAINYLHSGKSKFWYCIQYEDGKTLQKEALNHFRAHFQKCSEYLRHKTIMINPYILKRKYPNLRITKMEQKKGEFIIAFGGSYHCGFNFGLNIAEAVNYATFDWLRQLPTTNYCLCRRSSVKASHVEIMKNLQNDEIISENQFFLEFKKQTLQLMAEQSELEGEQLEKAVINKCKYIQKNKKYRKKNKKSKNKGRVRVGNKVFDIQEFVQCDKCDIWRVIPEGKMKEEFGERFECTELGRVCGQKEEGQIDEGITLNQD